MERETDHKAVAENLRDAGCDDELINRFFTLLEEEKKRDALLLLSKHRRVLLDCCHAHQKKIDCLDYLVYRMEQNEL